ncbi:MAG: hypothetical protein ACLTSG_00790 [Lachnospiraceae bacterium]
MGNFENRILKIIDSHPNGIKAKDIAQIMGCDRKDVNSALFGRLKGLCIQDNAFLWHLADSKSATTPERKAAADKRLSDLCRYYLNCLSLEESGGISSFLTSGYSLNYAELPSLAVDSSDETISSNSLPAVHSTKSRPANLGYLCAYREDPLLKN